MLRNRRYRSTRGRLSVLIQLADERANDPNKPPTVRQRCIQRSILLYELFTIINNKEYLAVLAASTSL
ncbi:MAG TPA: hypothetical protein VGP72_16605 [Planctomycetota bacterium]|jgi:hypothetical protein